MFKNFDKSKQRSMNDNTTYLTSTYLVVIITYMYVFPFQRNTVHSCPKKKKK